MTTGGIGKSQQVVQTLKTHKIETVLGTAAVIGVAIAAIGLAAHFGAPGLNALSQQSITGMMVGGGVGFGLALSTLSLKSIKENMMNRISDTHSVKKKYW